MSKLRKIISETHAGEPLVTLGSPSILNPELIGNINVDFEMATSGAYVTPYKPWIAARRLLDQYGITIDVTNPAFVGDSKEIISPIAQYGSVEDAEEVGSYFFYFGYYVNDEGMYEAHAEITTEEGLNDLAEDDEYVTEGWSKTGLKSDGVLGRFKHKETNKDFEYSKHDDAWAKKHNLPHKIHMTGDEHRYGTVKGTVAHIAVDENPDGSPKMEKWPLKQHKSYVKEDNIQEVSNELVGRYIRKSNRAFKKTVSDFGKARETGDKEGYDKNLKVIQKRDRGLKLTDRRKKRLTKEAFNAKGHYGKDGIAWYPPAKISAKEKLDSARTKHRFSDSIGGDKSNYRKPKAAVKEAFDEKAAFDTLRKEYAKIERVDPMGAAYKKMIKFLDGLDQAHLKKLEAANIKWLSSLARNRIKK